MVAGRRLLLTVAVLAVLAGLGAWRLRSLHARDAAPSAAVLVVAPVPAPAAHT